MTIEIRVLQALRLKGRATAVDVAAAAGTEAAEVQPVLAQLVAEGHCEEAKGRVKLTKPGRAELDQRLADERSGVDQGAR